MVEGTEAIVGPEGEDVLLVEHRVRLVVGLESVLKEPGWNPTEGVEPVLKRMRFTYSAYVRILILHWQREREREREIKEMELGK